MKDVVTCYFQVDDDVKCKVLSKLDVPSFVDEHQNSPCIIVCDPRERTNAIYEYGKLQRSVS